MTHKLDRFTGNHIQVWMSFPVFRSLSPPPPEFIKYNFSTKCFVLDDFSSVMSPNSKPDQSGRVVSGYCGVRLTDGHCPFASVCRIRTK